MYMIMRTRTYIHIKTPTQMCINTYIYINIHICAGTILLTRNSFPPFT